MINEFIQFFILNRIKIHPPLLVPKTIIFINYLLLTTKNPHTTHHHSTTQLSSVNQGSTQRTRHGHFLQKRHTLTTMDATSTFFDRMVNLIPIQMYLPPDEDKIQNQWKSKYMKVHITHFTRSKRAVTRLTTTRTLKTTTEQKK